jgi:hypothetical protein
MRHTRSTQCLCELTTNSAALVFSQLPRWLKTRRNTSNFCKQRSEERYRRHGGICLPRSECWGAYRVAQWVHPVFIADHNHRRGLGCSLGGLRRVKTANACAAHSSKRYITCATQRGSCGAARMAQG